jgi:hypothetical protein
VGKLMTGTGGRTFAHRARSTRRCEPAACRLVHRPQPCQAAVAAGWGHDRCG